MHQNYSEQFVNKRIPVLVRIKKRLYYYFVIPILTMALFVGLYYVFQKSKGEWTDFYTLQGANLYMEIKNCKVEMKRTPGIGELKFSYYINKL